MRNSLRSFILIAGLILFSLPARAQEPNLVATWLTLVNEARPDEGLAPYDFSTDLTAAAQRHADDLAANQISSHTGSDGSTVGQRITGAGYAAWTGEGEELIVGENIWTGQGTIEDAMVSFLDDPAHRDNILSPIYREIGIGAATDADGHNYYVLDFGARPNVLPIFINDGATNTDSPQVAIRLTNEDAHPGGKGAIFMGQLISTPAAPGLTPLAPNITPFPTWTPLPTATPEEASDQEASSPDAPLALLAVLQGVVIILGIYLALRRGGNRRTDA